MSNQRQPSAHAAKPRLQSSSIESVVTTFSVQHIMAPPKPNEYKAANSSRSSGNQNTEPNQDTTVSDYRKRLPPADSKGQAYPIGPGSSDYVDLITWPMPDRDDWLEVHHPLPAESIVLSKTEDVQELLYNLEKIQKKCIEGKLANEDELAERSKSLRMLETVLVQREALSGPSQTAGRS